MKKELPLVSIIIPTYNRASIISKSIESALNQTYKNIEIIVADNNSTDGTLDFIKNRFFGINQLKIIQNKENIGPVRNWIKGIQESKGVYTKLLFSDDWIDDSYIENTINMMNNSIGFIYTPAVIHKKNGNSSIFYKTFSKPKVYSSKKYLFYSLIGFKTPVSPGCAIYRKKDLLESLSAIIDPNMQKEYLKYGAGIDLYCFLNIAKNYSNVGYLNDTYSHFLQHDNSFTSANSLNNYYLNAKLFFLSQNKYYKSDVFLKLIIKTKIDKLIAFISNRINLF